MSFRALAHRMIGGHHNMIGTVCLGEGEETVRSDYRAERGRGGPSAEVPEEAAHIHGLFSWCHRGRAVRRWMASARTRPRSCVVRRCWYSSYPAARTCASRCSARHSRLRAGTVRCSLRRISLLPRPWVSRVAEGWWKTVGERRLLFMRLRSRLDLEKTERLQRSVFGVSDRDLASSSILVAVHETGGRYSGLSMGNSWWASYRAGAVTWTAVRALSPT